MTGPWRLRRGATALERGVQFTVWAPDARDVSVRIVAGPGAGEHGLSRGKGGVFAGVVDAAGAGSEYVYLLDGHKARPDPVSRWQPRGVHGPSRVVDPAAFVWGDAAWPGRDVADLVIYELHVGTFSAAGTFESVVPRLPYLVDLGVTAIELMPVGEFPGPRNWGYDGVALYAPQSTYGGPEGLKRLVDAAHRVGLAVVLDVVYNHQGPEGGGLGDFGPYFADDPATPWGRGLRFASPDSGEVRRYVLDNARYWVSEYHVDGLRLDAVQAMHDASPRHILAELADAVHATAAALRRRAVVIAETDANDPRLVRPAAAGGFGLDAQWSDDFHHAVHAALTGERAGYYADFGGVEGVARALRDRFVLDGRYSRYRGRRHGAPAHDLPGDRFVTFVQNHDQVGNRPGGERLGALVGFDARKLATALLLLAPYVPLLFMGEEYGETSPFLYFVSHGNAALREAVRDGRRREHAGFGWRDAAPDPGAAETFARSRLRWRLADSPHRELLNMYRALLRLRCEEPALRPGCASMTVASDAGADWIIARLEARGGAPLLGAYNFAAEAREVPLAPGGVDGWRLRFTTDDPAYGGAGRVPVGVAPGLTLPGCTAALYRLERAGASRAMDAA